MTDAQRPIRSRREQLDELLSDTGRYGAENKRDDAEARLSVGVGTQRRRHGTIATVARRRRWCNALLAVGLAQREIRVDGKRGKIKPPALSAAPL